MTPDEYIAALDEPRQTEVRAIDALIRKSAPELERFLGAGMIGYGRYHYRYASGREGDTAIIGLASRKQLQLWNGVAAGTALSSRRGEMDGLMDPEPNYP